MPKYPEEYESLFEDAFRKAANSLPAYSQEKRRQSWEKVKHRVNRQSKRLRLRRQAQTFGLVAASMILGAALFSPPVVTKAISPIYQELKNLGSGVTQLVFGYGRQQQNSAGAKTPPPPDGLTEDELREVKKTVHLVDAGTYNYVEMNIDEARERLAFSLPRITYIPERFTLQSLNVVIPEGTPEDPNTFGKSAHLVYKTADDHMLRLIFDLLMNNELLSTTEREATKEVELDNGNIAFITTGDLTKINMMIGNVYFNAFGDVSEEEMLAIANGLN
ncbi:DUF4367 domain-containing protein [Paenibacillus sp. M1]|uniref:DUF4367 domain-containing protein n=1 Tax=Paenibacillus haidiansis TaxID=1574488 RepID=A0ABU7VV05_9BACL